MIKYSKGMQLINLCDKLRELQVTGSLPVRGGDRVELTWRLCNGLPRNGPGFDSRWERCKNRASRPSQGQVNGGAVSK